MHASVNRIARTSVAAVLALTISGAAFAWEVDWVNHRRVHYSIDNRSSYDIAVDSKDVYCTTGPPGTVYAYANKVSVNSDWEWKFTLGCAQPTVTLRLVLASGSDRACEVVFKTSLSNQTGSAGQIGVTNFSGTPNIGANCQVKLVNDDPKSPRDSVVIVVHGAMKPYTPK